MLEITVKKFFNLNALIDHIYNVEVFHEQL